MFADPFYSFTIILAMFMYKLLCSRVFVIPM